MIRFWQNPTWRAGSVKLLNHKVLFKIKVNLRWKVIYFARNCESLAGHVQG
jgi:hypothetical protein